MAMCAWQWQQKGKVGINRREEERADVVKTPSQDQSGALSSVYSLGWTPEFLFTCEGDFREHSHLFTSALLAHYTITAVFVLPFSRF